MTNRLLIYSLSIGLILIHNSVPLAYGQSGCENADWGSPLEHDLNVRDPFDPPHYGTDYRAADGDNARAVADGTISTIDYKEKQRPNRLGLQVSGWGKYVVVKHKDGSTTLYAHLQENSTNHLSEGQEVTKGTIIGKADSTPSGGVTGPHLHLEYAPDGRWWDKQSRKDPHPCLVSCPQEPVVITISGLDAPTDGSQYTASGGTEPYTWSITKGVIDLNGIVTVSGQCGAATITATDSCSNTGTKDVRMPSGKWVLASQYSTCDAPTKYFMTICSYFVNAYTLVYENIYCIVPAAWGLPPDPACTKLPSCSVGGQYTCTVERKGNARVDSVSTYQWSCP